MEYLHPIQHMVLLVLKFGFIQGEESSDLEKQTETTKKEKIKRELKNVITKKNKI